MNIQKIYIDYKNKLVSLDFLREKTLEFSYLSVNNHSVIEPGEVVLELIPKIDELIKNYREDKASFFTYITKHIKWICLTKIKKNRKEYTKHEAWSYHTFNEYKSLITVQENESIFLPLKNELKDISEFTNLDRWEKKRLLILTLKNSSIITDTLVDKIAAILEIDKKCIYEKIREVNGLCQKKAERRTYLLQRINRLFIEITKSEIVLENELNLIKKQQIILSLETKKERLHEMQRTIRTKNFGPKNQDIADVLGVAKGTIDSALFALRKNGLKIFENV
jgi:hypothetical protein